MCEAGSEERVGKRAPAPQCRWGKHQREGAYHRPRARSPLCTHTHTHTCTYTRGREHSKHFISARAAFLISGRSASSASSMSAASSFFAEIDGGNARGDIHRAVLPLLPGCQNIYQLAISCPRCVL